MIKPTISYSEFERLAEHGSPVILRALGRLFGIGPAERDALGAEGLGGVPTWIWVTGAFMAGAVAGVRVQKRWPHRVPELIQGE